MPVNRIFSQPLLHGGHIGIKRMGLKLKCQEVKKQ